MRELAFIEYNPTFDSIIADMKLLIGWIDAKSMLIDETESH
jgi:hypothetical protein